MIEVINEVINFIYPDNIKCILCECPISKTNTYSLCKTCFDELNFIKDGCIKCGKITIRSIFEEIDIDQCEFCKNKTYYFDKVISCVEYTETSKKIVFDFKYKSKTYLSKIISQMMKEKLESESIECDCILSVPLHKKRYKERGFNQSEKIARYLSKEMNIPYLNLITRNTYTRKLYNLDYKERRIELRNTFKIKNIDKVRNKKVLIVDDIFTTGATVNEISKLLKKENISNIYVVTFLSKIK